MKQFIFDVESNNLLREATKIHCLAYCDVSTGLVCSTSYQEQIKDFFLQEDIVLIGHNIVSYDISVIEKIYGITVKAKLVDTLGLSWTLSPERKKHGLESWGESLGIQKPEITDWNDITEEEMKIIKYYEEHN